MIGRVLPIFAMISSTAAMCTVPFIDLVPTGDYATLTSSQCVLFATTSIYARTDAMADACAASEAIDLTTHVIFVSKEGGAYTLPGSLVKDVYQTSTLGTVYHDCDHPPTGKSAAVLSLFYTTTSVNDFESHALAVQDTNNAAYTAPDAPRPRVVLPVTDARVTNPMYPKNTWQPFHTITDRSSFSVTKSILDLFHGKRFLALLTYAAWCTTCKASISGIEGGSQSAVHPVLYPLLRKHDVAVTEVHDAFQLKALFTTTGMDTMLYTGSPTLHNEYGKNLTDLPYYIMAARRDLEPDDVVLGAFSPGMLGMTVQDLYTFPDSTNPDPAMEVFHMKQPATQILLLENTGTHVRVVTKSYTLTMRHDAWLDMGYGSPQPNTCKLVFDALGGSEQDKSDCFAKESTTQPMTRQDTCQINRLRYGDYCNDDDAMGVRKGVRDIHHSYSCCQTA